MEFSPEYNIDTLLILLTGILIPAFIYHRKRLYRYLKDPESHYRYVWILEKQTWDKRYEALLDHILGIADRWLGETPMGSKALGVHMGIALFYPILLFLISNHLDIWRKRQYWFTDPDT